MEKASFGERFVQRPQNPLRLITIVFAMVMSCVGLLLIAPSQAQAYEYKVTIWPYDMETDLTDASSISMDELSEGFWVEYYYDGSEDPLIEPTDKIGGIWTYLNLYDLSTSKALAFKSKGDAYIYSDYTGGLKSISHTRSLITLTKSALHSLTSDSKIQIVSGPGYYITGVGGLEKNVAKGTYAIWSLAEDEDSDGDQTAVGSDDESTGSESTGTGKDEGVGGSDSGTGETSTKGSGSTESNRTAKGLTDTDSTQNVDTVESASGSGGTKAASSSTSKSAEKTSSTSTLDIIGTIIPDSSAISSQEDSGTSSNVLMDQTLTLVGWPLAYLIMTILFIAALPFGLGRRLALFKWGTRRSSRLRL